MYHIAKKPSPKSLDKAFNIWYKWDTELFPSRE